MVCFGHSLELAIGDNCNLEMKNNYAYKWRSYDIDEELKSDSYLAGNK